MLLGEQIFRRKQIPAKIDDTKRVSRIMPLGITDASVVSPRDANERYEDMMGLERYKCFWGHGGLSALPQMTEPSFIGSGNGRLSYPLE